MVVVRSDHKNGIDGLKGLNYCHPGLHYDRSEKWTERVLKHFERTVATPDCDFIDASATPAEIETSTLAKLFNAACRPGVWSNNAEEDAKLSKLLKKFLEIG